MWHKNGSRTKWLRSSWAAFGVAVWSVWSHDTMTTLHCVQVPSAETKWLPKIVINVNALRSEQNGPCLIHGICKCIAFINQFRIFNQISLQSKKIKTGSGNGLERGRRLSISWTNDDKDLWNYNEPLGHNERKRYFITLTTRRRSYGFI